jgi:transposase
VDLRRETDVEQLRRIALAQQVQIEQLLRVLASKCRELETLKGDPAELQQTLALLETLTKKAQAAKAEADAAGSPRKASSERKPRTKFGPSEQPDLAKEPELFELEDADRICPQCGGELNPMKGQFETSEMIDVIEVRYRLVQVQQQKYVCRCGGCVETAPGPERATAGSRYSLRFAIRVAIDKYLDHIPLARQERILRRHGVEITTQTLWGLLLALARRLEANDRALLERALADPVIGLDQTSWKRLDDKKKKPWQIWCVTAPGVVVHRIRKDKGADTFKELVGKYKGVIVCDAAKTHEAGARELDDIVLAGCWAHAYRKFEEAASDHPEAHLAMGWIGELYEIDERAGDDLARKAELRRAEAPAVLEKLKTWLWSQAVLKTLSIGNAAGYAIANWDRLTRFVNDARIPLDNNATERGIRGPVVGRRNHFGSKSERGTEVAATFYTLIETAKLNGLDPAEYLLEAVRAADRGELLLPLPKPN